MRLTERQKEIKRNLYHLREFRKAYTGGEPFTGFKYSKREKRLLREFWAIEKMKGGPAAC